MAKKEHDEFASNIDLIDVLPPGLYEAVMVPKDPAQRAADLIGGDYLVRFEPRTLDDIRALGGNDENDDRKFETVARVSDINLGLYRMFVQPWVRLWMNEDFAASGCAGCIRCDCSTRCSRPPIRSCGRCSRPLGMRVITASPFRRKTRYGKLRSCSRIGRRHGSTLIAICAIRCAKSTFDAVYGSPLLQALVGLKATDVGAARRLARIPRTSRSSLSGSRS